MCGIRTNSVVRDGALHGTIEHAASNIRPVGNLGNVARVDLIVRQRFKRTEFRLLLVGRFPIVGGCVLHERRRCADDLNLPATPP